MLTAYLNRLTISSYRPNTVDLRRRVLHNFEAGLVPRTLMGATRHDVEAFLARPLAPGSRRVYRSSLAHFYGWAVEEGLVPTDPTQKVPSIRVAHGTPRPITDDQLRQALSVANPRMRAWLLLMALGGLRCMEVSVLTPGDLVRTGTGWLLMLRETKGGAPAVVPAHEAVVLSLMALPTYSGTWWGCTPKHVSQATGAFLRAAGVDATAHQLRHSAATSWLRASGHDLLTTSQLMRHKSVATTTIYTQLDPTRPAEVVGLVHLAG